VRKGHAEAAANAVRKAEKHMREIDDLDLEIAKRKREQSGHTNITGPTENEMGGRGTRAALLTVATALAFITMQL
jgi:hypothetical protein